VKRPYAYIAGTGRGIPATVFMNSEFAKIGIDTTDEWIVERTGIRQRHIAKTESATDLAASASREAMKKANVHAGEIDLIVLGTASPDRLLPSAAVDLQAALGASRAAALDVGAACSGFIYGATVAEGMMMSTGAETALVVGVEKLSAITDWQDRSTCVLFGDGAGAVVLKRSKQHRSAISCAGRPVALRGPSTAMS
jgi:3-oxoacyl-[acyl-carrier-protein] synthase-3